MTKKYIPAQCKKCALFHNKGVKDGKHNIWCCNFGGGPAYKKISHCKLHNGFKEKT